MKKKKIALVALGLCSVLAVAGCKDDVESSVVDNSTSVDTSTESAGLIKNETEKMKTLRSYFAETNTKYLTLHETYKLKSSTGYTMPTKTQKDPGSVAAELDVVVNYKGEAGPTLQKVDSYTNPIDGFTYNKNDILPTWKAFQEHVGTTIKDRGDYTAADDKTQHSKIYKDAETKFVHKPSNANIDLYMNTTANMSDAGSNNHLVDLLEYIDKMPNYKKFLQDNPSVAQQLINDNDDLFIAPYFDGKDEIEKMFMMDTNMIEKLLDAADPKYDTADKLPDTYYEAYLPTYNNTKIAVVGLDGNKTDITLTSTKDVITMQNELETQDGKSLTNALKTYLQDTYGDYVGTGRIYEKYSEIFTSASAAYNCDELVALMRCVKTNTQYLTGQNKEKVLVAFPREGKSGRMQNIPQMASMWGIQGLTSETDYLYYDKDGKLRDARTTEKSYLGLVMLSQLYDEGLIKTNYADKVDANFAATYIPKGQGFMEYDYNATSALYNEVDENGIGTKTSTTKGFRPVLAPVTYWDNDDHSTYQYTRYTEDNRTLKPAGWCIPSNSDNIAGALELIDYMFTEEGAYLQDFGPEEYRETELMVLADGTKCPAITKAVFEAISNDPLKGGWNNWYRRYIGSTQGIGHVRSGGLDYQVTNVYGRQGLENIQKAIKAGVMKLALSTNPDGFGKSVQTNWSISADAKSGYEKAAGYIGLTTFWAAGTEGTDGYHGAIQIGKNRLSK